MKRFIFEVFCCRCIKCVGCINSGNDYYAVLKSTQCTALWKQSIDGLAQVVQVVMVKASPSLCALSKDNSVVPNTSNLMH